MKGAHYAALTMLISAIALQLQTVPSWHQVLTPSTIGAMLFAIAGTMTALFSDKVQR